jgi:hypothetical protein
MLPAPPLGRGFEMSRILSRSFAATLPALLVVAVAGCGDPAAPSGKPPVAVAEIEIRTQHSSNPNPDYDATCQTTASLTLHATGSFDPEGQSLIYEWCDTVEGERTPDFFPYTNPLRTSEPTLDIGVFTIGVHEITLTVIAQDGRKGRTTRSLLVTTCEECGGTP